MLPDSPDVEQVLEGPDGIFTAIQPGHDPDRQQQHFTRGRAAAGGRGARARGAMMLDAPVSGGEIGAIGGTLSIMVGGDAAAFAEVRPILEAMGNPERIIRIGDSGRRAGLQGLQPDGDRRHARRGQRGVRAGAEGGRGRQRRSARRCSAASPPAASSKSTASAS